MKIRDNGNWVFQFGTNGPNNTNAWPSGTFIQNGNDVLTVSGTYNISFNRSTGAYNYASVLSNDAFAKGAFNVYPNPTINAWKFMSSADEIVGIEIFDILGKVVLSKNTSNVEVSVDASVLTNGVYLAKISSAKGFETIRIVKN